MFIFKNYILFFIIYYRILTKYYKKKLHKSRDCTILQSIEENNIKFLTVNVSQGMEMYNFKNIKVLSVIKLNFKKNQCTLLFKFFYMCNE